MPNLYLTHKCTRGCSFCFARKVLADGGGDVNELLTVEEVERLLEHFSGQFPELGLLGGEPFLYPYLGEVLELLRQRKILPKIFTSATNPMPDCLAGLDTDKQPITFVVNVGTRDSYSDEKYRNLIAFFSKFKQNASLSFTLFDLEADFSFLFDIIEEFQLKTRWIRVGVALPIYKGGNQYIRKEDYREAGRYFTRLAQEAARRQIRLGMDCGFVACMFAPEELGVLQRCGVQMAFCCRIALDIGPKLDAWSCFPLFQLHHENVLESETMKVLVDKFDTHLVEYFDYKPGIFEACGMCKYYKRKVCEGGCKSFKSI